MSGTHSLSTNSHTERTKKTTVVILAYRSDPFIATSVPYFSPFLVIKDEAE